MSECVEIYDKLLTADFCNHLIDKFEESPHRKAGVNGGGVDTTIKNSTDLLITSYPEWETEINIVLTTLLAAMVAYVRKYVFFLAGTNRPSFQHPETGEYVKLGPETIDLITDQKLATFIKKYYSCDSHINIQKYKAKEGGYFTWHSEIATHPDDTKCEILRRTLFYIFYLNDVDEGGETELYYQKQKVSPKAGRLLLSPAGFTHTHRGNMPISNDKYILTSWIVLQPADKTT